MKRAYIFFECFLSSNAVYRILFMIGMSFCGGLIATLFYSISKLEKLLYFYLTLIPLLIVGFNFVREYIAVYFLFKNGIKKHGKVVDIRTFKTSGYLVYEYDFQGQTYRASAIILKNRVKWFRFGQNLLVTIDPNKPNRAIVEEVYS